MKKRKCQEYDIDVDIITFEKDTNKEQLLIPIKYNKSGINGLMVQLPQLIYRNILEKFWITLILKRM